MYTINFKYCLARLAAAALTVVNLGWAQAILAQSLNTVILKTTQGNITIELDAEKAPRTVENFIRYVKEGHYDGTIFHRVMDNFMIQGGGFTKDMQQKPTHAPIPLESQNGLKNVRGSVAMARSADPNSATAQFFINVVDNPRLDYPSFDGFGYTVFGKVIQGLEVVDKIRFSKTSTRGFHQNVPLEPSIIESAVLIQSRNGS